MKKYNFLFSLLAISLFLFSGCEDDPREENLYPSMVYIANDGFQEQIIYNTGELFSATLGISKSGALEAAAEVKMAILSDSELEAWNSENNTNYVSLPANCYEIPQSEFNFSSDRTDAKKLMEIKLDPSRVSELPDISGTYVVAVKIANSTLEVNEEKTTAFIHPVVHEPLFYLSNAGETVFDFSYGRISDTEETIPVELAIDANRWSIEVEMSIDKDYIAAYNTDRGTAYTELPAGMYTLEKKMTFEPGETKYEVELTLIGAKLDIGEYMLPLRLQNTTKFGFDTDRDLQVIIVKVAAPLLDRSGWTIAEVNTEERSGEGEGNGTAICMLDDNENTFWHSRWDGGNDPLPHTVVIDMQQEYTVAQIDLLQRRNSSMTISGNFYLSSDNTSFTKIGEFAMADNQATQYFGVTPTKGRYLKMEVTGTHDNTHSALAELMVHGF